MIYGIGADIVSIERIRRAIGRHEGRFARKVLSSAEWAIYGGHPNAAAYVAKRFAAKEAFFKAFGQPSSVANNWHQLSIGNDAAGRPRLEFGLALASLVAGLGIKRWHVSLSDEREYAIAYLILEND